MVAVVASWTDEEGDQLAIVVGGTALVLLLSLVSLQRGELRRETGNPGDYEEELIRLCGGGRRMAESGQPI